MTQDEKQKKIIIDQDWKQQAQKEKETLAEQEQAQQETAEQFRLPPADFAGLVSMLATQAFFAMGLIRTENETQKGKKPDLILAKYNIDMLEVIEQKTKGNLTDDEQKLIDQTLHQLRMVFVKLSE